MDLFAGNEWAVRYIRNHRFRCYDDVKNIIKLQNGSRVLNVGGAPYAFEVLGASSGLSITSLDLEPDRHSGVLEGLGISVIKADIEQKDKRNDINFSEYDVISMCEVLEHMRIDLLGLFFDLKNSIREDCKIYLTTPNFYFARSFFLCIFSRRSGPSLVKEWGKLSALGHMGHVREYSKRELIELFEYAGFTVDLCLVRNRSSYVRMTPKWFLPTLIFSFLEKVFDLFGQEFVFVLRRKN